MTIDAINAVNRRQCSHKLCGFRAGECNAIGCPFHLPKPSAPFVDKRSVTIDRNEQSVENLKSELERLYSEIKVKELELIETKAALEETLSSVADLASKCARIWKKRCLP